MLCELCTSVGRIGLGEAQHRNNRTTGEGVSISCDACGMPLGETVGDRVVETLAQLSRFGLTGQNLLSRRRT
jgi:hypothetical protein